MGGFYPSSAGGAGQGALNATSRAERSRSAVSLRAVTAAGLALLVLSALLGNALVCAAVPRSRRLRSKLASLFVFSLAAADLLVAVLVMPWRAAADVLGFWPFGAFCDVWVALDIVCCTASVLPLCLISLERHRAIASPCRHRSVALAAIGGAWLLSLLVSFVPVQLRWHKERELPGREQPARNGSAEEGSCDSSLGRTYAVSSSLVSFYIPVAVMLGTYGRLFRTARRRLRRISPLESAAGHGRSCPGSPREASLKNSLRKETKLLRTLSIIMGVFVCCWLPFFVLSCLAPFCDAERRERGALPCGSGAVLGTFTWLGRANSALNPIIYAFNAEFRGAFASLLGCGGAVEAVTVSNELASFHPDSAARGAAETLGRPPPLPLAVLRVENSEASLDGASPGCSPRHKPFPECGTPISLGRLPPLASSAFP